MSTFSTLWQEVRLGIGNRKDIDTEIKAAMNDAVIDIVMTFKIRQAVAHETVTTDAEVSQYELNENCLDVISVRNDTDAVPLTKGDKLDYDSHDYEDADSTGTPNFWFVDEDSIYFYGSTPDDTGFELTYSYVKRFEDMSGDSDAFPLPREWERPAKLFAKSYVFELLGQNQKAVAAYQQGVAVARTRKAADAWGELLRGDNRINMSSVSDEGF